MPDLVRGLPGEFFTIDPVSSATRPLTKETNTHFPLSDEFISPSGQSLLVSTGGYEDAHVSVLNLTTGRR